MGILIHAPLQLVLDQHLKQRRLNPENTEEKSGPLFPRIGERNVTSVKLGGILRVLLFILNKGASTSSFIRVIPLSTIQIKMVLGETEPWIHVYG